MKTYHMKELLTHPEKLDLWLKLKETGTTDWNALYSGYQATVDFPAYPWYKEHMQKYPDAKVILTIRPFEKWYSSVTSTIWQAGPQTLPQKLGMLAKMAFNSKLRGTIKAVKFAKSTIFGVHMQGRFEDKDFAHQMFDKHIADVKAFVPAEKLLVYDVSEGWEPLCTFLDVPQPTEEFPHLNKKENFKEMLKELISGTGEH